MNTPELESLRARLKSEREHLRWVIETNHNQADSDGAGDSSYTTTVEARIARLERRISEYLQGNVDGK